MICRIRSKSADSIFLVLAVLQLPHVLRLSKPAVSIKLPLRFLLGHLVGVLGTLGLRVASLLRAVCGDYRACCCCNESHGYGLPESLNRLSQMFEKSSVKNRIMPLAPSGSRQ